MEKAYKLLSKQLGVSHSRAKAMIDNGLISARGKKLGIARMMMPKNTTFEVSKIKQIEIIFQGDEHGSARENGDILALNKSAFMESYDIQSRFGGYELLHRLDRETSGVLLLGARGSEFAKNAINAFKKRQVKKVYYALVEGIVAESSSINAPLSITKGNSARARVCRDGVSAISHIFPESIYGKKTLLKVIIETGRTHQIRAHLKHIGHPIIGDMLYGGKNAKRLMLHASELEILGNTFYAPLPQEFMH